MLKINAALAAFIDERYTPFEARYKFIVAALITLIPCVLLYFAFYQPGGEELAALDAQRARLDEQLEGLEGKAHNLAALEEELQQTRETFNYASELLPKEKEIPRLLQDISSLGRTAGLDFLNFQPMPDVPGIFYTEIPVNINIRGPYHGIGYFLDRVSQLGRIVSINNIKMANPRKEGGKMLLDSSCQLVTYRINSTRKARPERVGRAEE